MIIKRVRPDGRAPRSGELFIGTHEYQRIIGGDESSQFHLSEMTFRDGTRTRLHVHTSEQVIVVLSGTGIIATPDVEREIVVGDVAFVAADERHWHGVRPNGEVTLLSVLGPHSTRRAEI